MVSASRVFRRVAPGLFVAGLCAAMSGCAGEGDANRDPSDSSAAAAVSAADPVQSFRSFARRLDQMPAGAPLEPAAMAEGLRTMAGALGTAGLAPPELLVDLRVAAEHVLLNPESTEVTATVRTALGNAAAVLPEASRAPAQKAADAINASMPLTAQGGAVSDVFRTVSQAMPAQASAP